MPLIDDGKSLFDFMPGAGQAQSTVIDPLDPPKPDETDPALTDLVLAAMRTVFDPELPVNIVELGLIYDLAVGRDGRVFVDMTLTAPNCPVAGSLPGEIAATIRAVPGVTDATIRLVWTPPWEKSMMSEAALLELGLL